MPTVVSGRALGRDARAAAASERLTLGVIGFGPRCKYVLTEILKCPDIQCVGLADVQAAQRDAGKALVDGHYGTADCRVYGDMRELLARPDINCVLIATGDRWHGKAAMMAAEAGKDVYCEKPCGLTIDVCRRIAETMRKTGRIFQAGTQRRSVPNFIRVKELVQEGKIGPLTEMHASVYVPSLNNNWLPAQPTPDPEQCDWNVWLGSRSAVGYPQGGGGGPEMAAKQRGHVGHGAEARPWGDLLERQVGRGDEAAGLVQPHVQDVAVDRAADRAPKPVLKLPPRELRGRHELGDLEPLHGPLADAADRGRDDGIIDRQRVGRPPGHDADGRHHRAPWHGI